MTLKSPLIVNVFGQQNNFGRHNSVLTFLNMPSNKLQLHRSLESVMPTHSLYEL